jgi:plastocyanin
MSHTRTWVLVAMLGWSAAGLHAQATTPVAATTVRGRVEVIGDDHKDGKRHGSIPGTVIWLTPIGGVVSEGTSATALADPPLNLRLTQKNKSFEPHFLVVPAGSLVEFPNRDPFFHNVFSLFEGKRFDLGLYEAGTSRMVRFDRPGISYVFCNIHPEMSAVVITVATRLYAVADAAGHLTVMDVPFGRYMLHVWSEGMGSENTQPQTREITISESAPSLGVILVPDVSGQHMAHRNKYDREYDEPVPNSSVYGQPH